MPWYSQQYTPEYDATSTALAGGGFAANFAAVSSALARLLGTAGFEPSGAASLAALRAWATTPRPGDPSSADEATRLLDAAGAGPGMAAAERQRSAALKMLRHVYLAQQRGGQTAWVVSLPLDFTDWPAAAFAAGNADAVKTLLRSSNERFSSTDIGNLSSAMLSALRWCQKAQVVLGALNGTGAAKVDAVKMVRTWFGDGTTSDTDLVTQAAALRTGFNTITSALNRNQVVLTDFVPLRGAAAGTNEYGFLHSEAFVFGLAGRERLDVIYVEEEFFGTNNVLTGQANWARILVHEMSHMVVGTVDVAAGTKKRYAWYGIAPNANFSTASALTNAENWAFFAADCAGALSPGEKARALTVR
jgi:hypothetical protein